MRAILALILLSILSSFAQLDEVLVRNAEEENEEILIFDDRKDLNKFRRLTRNVLSAAAVSIQDLVVGGSLSLFTIENLSTGVILKNGILRPSHIHHDVDKVYSSISDVLPKVKVSKRNLKPTPLRHWSLTKVGTKIAVPLNIALGETKAMGFYTRSEAGRNGFVQVISPINEYLYKEDQLVDALLSKVKRGFRSVRKVKITTNPLTLWERYPYGTEISRSREFIFVQAVGAEKGIASLKADANIFAVYHYTGVGTIKILGDPDRKLIKLTIEKKHRKGRGRQGSFELEHSLFKIGFVEAKLNIKFITGTREKSETNDYIHEYIYDLEYPEALDALRSAINGKLQVTQALAVDRGGVALYKGILVERDATIILNDVLKRNRVGLSVNENYMKVMDAAIRRQKIEKNYLYDEVIKLNRKNVTKETDLYNETKTTTHYEHTDKRYKASFWRLWGKYYRSTHIDSQIINKTSVVSGVGATKQDHFKFKYDFKLIIKTKSKRLKRKYYDSISHIANLTKLVDPSNGPFMIEDFCTDDDLSVRLNAEILEGAIAHILSLSDKELYQSLAHMAGLTNQDILINKKNRKKVANKLFKGEQLKKHLKNFDRKFIKYIQKARNAKNYYEVGDILRDLFSSYKGSIFPYEFILYLNQLRGEQESSATPFNDVRTSIHIQGPSCSLSWNLAEFSEIKINDK